MLTDNATGCSDTSHDISLTILDCSLPCCAHWSLITDDMECLTDSLSGLVNAVRIRSRLYYPDSLWKLSVRAIPALGGAFVTESLVEWIPGVYEVTGVYYLPPAAQMMCLQWMIKGNDGAGSCHVEVCRLLPPCAQIPPCPIISIDGGFSWCELDSAGNRMYILIINVEWGGSNNTPFNISFSGFTVVHFPDTFHTGGNQVFLAALDEPPFENATTFTISATDPVFGYCAITGFLDDVGCDTTPIVMDSCNIVATLAADSCLGTDNAGNWLVRYIFDLNNQEADSRFLFVEVNDPHRLRTVFPALLPAQQTTQVEVVMVVQPGAPLNVSLYYLFDNEHTYCLQNLSNLPTPCLSDDSCGIVFADGVFSCQFDTVENIRTYTLVMFIEYTGASNTPFTATFNHVDYTQTFSAFTYNGSLQQGGAYYAFFGLDSLPFNSHQSTLLNIAAHDGSGCTFQFPVYCNGEWNQDYCNSQPMPQLDMQMSIDSCLATDTVGNSTFTYSLVLNNNDNLDYRAFVIGFPPIFYQTVSGFNLGANQSGVVWQGVMSVADGAQTPDSICFRIALNNPTGNNIQVCLLDACHPYSRPCGSGERQAQWMMVFPNPAAEGVIATVAYDFGAENPDRILVTDYLGKTLADEQHPPAKGAWQTPTKNWSGGVYAVIALKNGKPLGVARLVIVR